MAIKRKISVWLCVFLTISPLLGSCITNQTTGEYLGNLLPYIGLTIPQIDGMPFADAIGALFALIIFMFGLLALIIFATTKFINTTFLKAFLIITIFYCGLRAIGGLFFNILFNQQAGIKTTTFISIAILSDLVWGYLGYFALKNIDIPIKH